MRVAIGIRCVVVILVFVIFKQALTTDVNSSTEKNEIPTPILEGWQNFENKVKYLSNSGVKLLDPIISKHFGAMNLSYECMDNIKYVISGMQDIKPWAMKFIDSSGKFFDGVLAGSFSSLGSYDECLDIEVKNRDFEDKLLFRGQYCTIMMQPPIPPIKQNFMELRKVPEELKNFSQRDTAVAELSKIIHLFYVTPLRLGVCLPSGCSIHDVNKMARLLGQEFSLEAMASRCEIKENTTFTPSAIFVIILYSFFGLLLLVGSSLDLYYSKAVCKNTAIRVLVAFSFFSNFKRLSSPPPKTNNFNCLFGIRFLGASWIIFAHGYVLLSNGLSHGFKEKDRQMQIFISPLLLNTSLCVDTFLFIGGMLVCYGTFHICKHQNKKFNVLMYIIHRLWRILPSYLFVLVAVYIIHMLGSGPIWHDMLDPTLEYCYKNWWANVLFLQNFFDTNTPCFVHFWYIAVDFQLYIFALVILLPMLKCSKIGVSFAVLTIVASVIYSGIVTYFKELPPTLMFTVVDIPTILTDGFKRYFKPFIHAGPYALGLLAGYLLSIKPKIKMPPFLLAMGWFLAFVLTFSVLEGTLPWYRLQETSLATDLAYVSLNRIAWTLGVGWMIVCCATGNGGIIDRILSLGAFVPLGRLSYLAYLVHFPMQYVFIGNIRTRIQSSIFFISSLCLSHIVLSFMLAFLVNMMVEAPFTNLEKIFFTKLLQTEEKFKVAKGQDTFTMDVKSGKDGDIAERNGDIAEKNGDIVKKNGDIVRKNGDITPIPTLLV